MKKILAYISPEKHCSLFDIIVAYDSGVDVVVQYNNVALEDVRDIVYGCCFTRHPRDLKDTGIFVGGYSIEKAEALASEALKTLEELPDELNVSVMVDPNGAYTTASACVAKVNSTIPVKDSKAVVLAGTGPVGVSTARLLAGLGGDVRLTSRTLERARKAAESIKGNVTGVKAESIEEIEKAVKDADVVVSAGAAGVQLLPKSVWGKNDSIKVLADTNAVPPYGIEGVKPMDDGLVTGNKTCFGAIAIGNLKMKLHQKAVKQMFNGKNKNLRLGEIHGLHENPVR